MRQLNQKTLNPISLILETLFRLASKSPRYFRVMQIAVFVLGLAVAVLHYLVDPATVIHVFGPAVESKLTEVLVFLGGILVTLKLPVPEKAEVKEPNTLVK